MNRLSQIISQINSSKNNNSKHSKRKLSSSQIENDNLNNVYDIKILEEKYNYWIIQLKENLSKKLYKKTIENIT